MTAYPSTPKSVHFASEKAGLESVVVFTKGARPRSLSNPGGNDTETETEAESGSQHPRAYPFPIMPVAVLDELMTTEVPSKALVGGNGLIGEEKRFVFVESIVLPGTRPPTLRGTSTFAPCRR